MIPDELFSGPMVAVEWEDSYSNDRWMDRSEFDAKMSEGFYSTRLGFLVYEDHACVILAADVTTDGKQAGSFMRIPRGNVRSIHYLSKENHFDQYQGDDADQ